MNSIDVITLTLEVLIIVCIVVVVGVLACFAHYLWGAI